MIRFFDFFFAFCSLLILSPVLIILILIGYCDTGSPFFVQVRVGKDKKPFKLVKFRSMIVSTKSVATHLVSPISVTKYGKYLRASKLDELPQLWNVMLGDMSLVGPRPNLFNQEELIFERDKMLVYTFKPGMTGLAQITHIGMSTPSLLAKTDAEMMRNLTIKAYFSYIFSTLGGKLYRPLNSWTKRG